MDGARSAAPDIGGARCGYSHTGRCSVVATSINIRCASVAEHQGSRESSTTRRKNYPGAAK